MTGYGIMIELFMRKIVFLFVCFSLQGEDLHWPNWLGPNHDGTTDSFALLDPPDGKDYSLVWTTKVGRGWASPVCNENTLVLHERDGENESLRAMDPLNGKLKWRFSYTSGYRDSFGMEDGPRSTPAISNGLVISHGPQGLVHAVSIKDGALQWKVDLAEKFSSPKGFFGRCSSPLVIDDKVVFDAGGPNAGMIAFELKTGKLAWSSTSYGNDYSSSVPFESRSGQLILSFVREGFLALNAKTGEEIFFERFRSPISASVNAASPIVIGNRVLLSSCYDVGAGLWNYRANSSDEAPFATLWKKKEALDCHYSSPVAFGGFAYGFHGRQERGPVLRCISLKDGEVKWEAPTFGAGNLIRAKDKLIVLSENGELIIAEASPIEFRELHRQQILGTGSRAYFSLSNDCLFARDQRRLVCLQLTQFE
jgi:outer membrane protein assembly factor BamB